MATFKSLVSRVRAFDRDEQGAAGSIEVVGAVAVGVIILTAVLGWMTGSDGILAKVKASITTLITPSSGAAATGGAS